MEIIGALLLFGVFGYFFWFATVGAGRSLGKKVSCPSCRRNGMHSSGARYYINGKHVQDWKCPHCGHKFTKRGM